MKTLKFILASMATMLLVTSCLKDKDSYQAGFSRLSTVQSFHFANVLSDQLVVESYGNWDITSNGQTADWCQLSPLRGYAGLSNVEIQFSENTTGKPRQASFLISDRDHADEAYSSFVIGQLATRGDGSLGNAAAVKSITGSDGSRIEATYDELHRPLTATIKKADELLWQLQFKYAQETMTVETNHGQFTADMTYDYQPSGKLVNGTWKMEFVEDEYFNLLNDHYSFQMVYRQGDDYEGLSYLMPSVRCLMPDSLHNADSLKYIRSLGGQVELIKMKPAYSQMDNRCQSVDVNQLLLGVERCNPFLLFSLFRQARNTSILSLVETDQDDTISVQAQLNADKSVRQLVVTRQGNPITYTFEY